MEYGSTNKLRLDVIADIDTYFSPMTSEQRIKPVRKWGKRTVIERFMSKVQKTDSCWIWKGNTNKAYGKFTVGRVTLAAHRFSYHFHRGPILNGLTVDHLCCNPKCVNPDHMELVTQSVNTIRGSPHKKKTHCPKGHPYNLENTLITKDGARACRECGRRRHREWYYRISRQRQTAKLNDRTLVTSINASVA